MSRWTANKSFAAIRDLAPRQPDNPVLFWDIARLPIDGAAQSNVKQNEKIHRRNEKTSRREDMNLWMAKNGVGIFASLLKLLGA